VNGDWKLKYLDIVSKESGVRKNSDNLLVQNRSNNCKGTKTEHQSENNFAVCLHVSILENHVNRNDNECGVRAHIEDCLHDRIVGISGTLAVLDWNCPVLGEGATEDTKVREFDESETEDNVNEENIKSAFVLGKLAT
jgi:hypothetical protein